MQKPEMILFDCGWANQNDGLTIEGEHLRIRRWAELTTLLEGMNE